MNLMRTITDLKKHDTVYEEDREHWRTAIRKEFKDIIERQIWRQTKTSNM